jgi:hypothetical protein
MLRQLNHKFEKIAGHSTFGDALSHPGSGNISETAEKIQALPKTTNEPR